MKTSIYNCYFPDFYIFNTLKRTLIKLDDRSYNSLRNNTTNIFSAEEIKTLNELGLIVEDKCDETVLLDKMISNVTSRNLCLIQSLSSSCNLRCPYCYETQRQCNNLNKNLTTENWQIVKNYIKNTYNSLNKNYCQLTLYGGEPLVNYEMAHTILNDKFFSDNNINIKFDIITNGTLISKIIESNDYKKLASIQITLDGNKTNHDKFRIHADGTGSFIQIYNNILKLAELKYDKINIRINIDEKSDHITELIDKMADDKLQDYIQRIDIHWIYSDSSGRKQCESDHSDYEKVYQLYKYCVEKGFRIKQSYLKGPCYAIDQTNITLDENLNVYYCQGFLYDKSIGHLNSDGKLQIDNITTSSKKSCISKCLYAPLCYGGCTWAEPECRNRYFFDNYLLKYLILYQNSQKKH